MPDNIVPRPASLAEQVSAVQSVLAIAGVPLDTRDIARAFKGKHTATFNPVLEALAGINIARRMGDGRSAA